MKNKNSAIAYQFDLKKVSSQNVGGNVEGAKRPTAGDETRGFTPPGEGGRVPPFIEKLLKKGVTVVEVLLAFLILGIILSIGYSLVNSMFFRLERQRQALDTQHEARLFLALVERDLRETTKLITLDTIFKDNLLDNENALFFHMVLEVPNRSGSGLTQVTYSYEGPPGYQDLPDVQKVIYRQEAGKAKKPIITRQLKFLKVWGTDGAIFRSRNVGESIDDYYKSYLKPHYYFPSNSAPNGLKDLLKVRGVEVQFCMNEFTSSKGKTVKTRTFITRIYPRILNSKYE